MIIKNLKHRKITFKSSIKIDPHKLYNPISKYCTST